MQGSSRLFRSNRPQAGLQLLWTWSCTGTRGRPISSICWNKAKPHVLAAGYGSKAAAAAAAAPESARGGAADAGGDSSGSGSRTQAAAESPRSAREAPAAASAGSDAAADAPAAATAAGSTGSAPGGCVALWSTKNQLHPIWAFDTKSREQLRCALAAACTSCRCRCCFRQLALPLLLLRLANRRRSCWLAVACRCSHQPSLPSTFPSTARTSWALACMTAWLPCTTCAAGGRSRSWRRRPAPASTPTPCGRCACMRVAWQGA